MKILHTIKLKRWAKLHGIPEEILEDLIYFQPPKSTYVEAFKKMEPAPPLSYIGNIIRNNSEGFFPLATPFSQRLFVIGSCPNGDSVAIDLKEEIGSIRYISHEEVHETEDLWGISTKVADDLEKFIERYVEDDDFPYDYYEALK